jgi:hypothetical protein
MKVEELIIENIKSELASFRSGFDKDVNKKLNYSYIKGVIDGQTMILTLLYDFTYNDKVKEFGENYQILLSLNQI